jgi:hypothetical protein
MPGKGYPKDRVATTKYESGPVKSGLPAVSNAGKESMKTGRAGKSK